MERIAYSATLHAEMQILSTSGSDAGKGNNMRDGCSANARRSDKAIEYSVHHRAVALPGHTHVIADVRLSSFNEHVKQFVWVESQVDTLKVSQCHSQETSDRQQNNG